MDSVLKKNFFTYNLSNFYDHKGTRYDIRKYSFTASKPRSTLWSLQKLDCLGRK